MVGTVTDPDGEVKLDPDYLAALERASRDDGAAIRAHPAKSREDLVAAVARYDEAQRSLRACQHGSASPETIRTRAGAVEDAALDLDDAFDAARPRHAIKLGNALYAWARATLRGFVVIRLDRAIEVAPMRCRLDKTVLGAWRLTYNVEGEQDPDFGLEQLILLPKSDGGLLHVACGVDNHSAWTDVWIDDATHEKRVAEGSKLETEPVSKSPYAAAFRRMRAKWNQLSRDFDLG
jgi:hypothetical protein